MKAEKIKLMKRENIDINKVIIRFCPTICQLLINEKRFLKRTFKRHSEKISYIDSHVAQDLSVTTETNFLDLPFRFLSGDESAKVLMIFIDKIVERILAAIENKHHPAFKKIIKNLVSNFDNARSNYNDSLGELLILDKLTHRTNNILRKIEFKLKNEKSIDYLFWDNKKEKHFLVEVLNINLKDAEIQNSIGLTRLLDSRINSKIKGKLANIMPNDIEHELYFQPVIWGNNITLEKYKYVFIDFTKKDNLLDMCMFSFLENKKLNKYKFAFGPFKTTLL